MRDYREVMGAARDGTACDDATAARVEAAARRGRRPVRAASAVVVALAIAAAVLFALRTPSALDRSLDDAGAVPLGPYVDVDAYGSGAVTGSAKAMRLDWQDGTLSVEVEPERGVGLAVHTPDAVVRVVGTGFAVVTDALGTTVSVRHGQVDVTCLRGASAQVRTGATHVCLPPTATGALGRVLALRARAAPDALLTEIDDALALPDATGSAASELRILRVSALVAADRPDDALAEAEAVLAEPGATRTEELHRFAAQLRLRAGDCEGARPHVEALSAAGELGAEVEERLEAGGCRP